jgi:hypothetical protein
MVFVRLPRFGHACHHALPVAANFVDLAKIAPFAVATVLPWRLEGRTQPVAHLMHLICLIHDALIHIGSICRTTMDDLTMEQRRRLRLADFSE